MFRVVGSIVACAAFMGSAAAQTPASLAKEGTIDLISIYQATSQAVVHEKEFLQYTFEAYGSLVGAAGSFGDGMTGKCIGSGRVLKGKLDIEIGSCRFVDSSGDAFITSHTARPTDKPSVNLGKVTIIGGTGKYAGITGNYEVTRRVLASPGQGRGAIFGVEKGSYKLP
jgi:hypothetical protein